MDFVFAALFGAALTGIVVTLVTAVRESRRHGLQRLARRYEGRVGDGGIFRAPRVEMTIDGVPAHLIHRPGGDEWQSWSRLTFDLRPPGRLRIAYQGISNTLLKLLGTQDIRIGDDAFDGLYLIQGAPESWVRTVVDAEFRRRVMAIEAMTEPVGWGVNVRVEAGPAGVTVWCGRHFVNEVERFDEFVALAVGVMRAIRGTPAEGGVKIVSAREAAVQGDCAVCANPLGGALKTCGRCRTPYHAECWTYYFGRCAIFGCGGR